MTIVHSSLFYIKLQLESLPEILYSTAYWIIVCDEIEGYIILNEIVLFEFYSLQSYFVSSSFFQDL